MDFQHLADQYRSELMDSVLPFWLEHVISEETFRRLKEKYQSESESNGL